MQYKFLFIFFIVICFFSCNGKSNTSIVSTEANDSISCNILGVNLTDNPYLIKDKLTKAGYHWEEDLSSSGICTISLKDEFSFSGYYFNKLNFVCLDAKIFMIHFVKECDSLSDAQKLYDEINNKIEEKYSEFKTEKKAEDDNNFMSYSEYDDGKTNLSVGLTHHEQEKILPFFDDELKHMAREYWTVIIYYSPCEQKEKKSQNDF